MPTPRRCLVLFLLVSTSGFAPARRALPLPAGVRASGRAGGLPSMRLDDAAQSRYESVLCRVVGRGYCAVGPPRGLRRVATFVGRRRSAIRRCAARVATVLFKSLFWGAVLAPALANAHPALAYVGYGREEVDVLRSESGSMGLVIPVSIMGVIATTMRQGSRSKKEIKRIKKAYKKIKEEEAEYLKVDGEAETDSDIMASLRNRTQTMADDEAAAEAAANAPPEPEPEAPRRRGSA